MEPWGTIEEGYCPSALDLDDNSHCMHWWDGQQCCRCEHGPMDSALAVEQGMFDTIEEADEFLKPKPQGEPITRGGSRRRCRSSRSASASQKPRTAP